MNTTNWIVVFAVALAAALAIPAVAGSTHFAPSVYERPSQ
jgi:hypothetical protein